MSWHVVRVVRDVKVATLLFLCGPMFQAQQHLWKTLCHFLYNRGSASAGQTTISDRRDFDESDLNLHNMEVSSCPLF